MKRLIAVLLASLGLAAAVALGANDLIWNTGHSAPNTIQADLIWNGSNSAAH
jgi:hypothetical protein